MKIIDKKDKSIHRYLHEMLVQCKCILIFEIYSVKVLIYFNVILT
jgi:hypothetical protein